jgi:hypothetical protein
MKTLLLVSVVAAGVTVTASTQQPRSVLDLVASIRSITFVGEAQAQSRRVIRCVNGGTVNGRFYCNILRARERGLIR